MSIHKSFKASKDGMSLSKSVLSRHERISILNKRGKIDILKDAPTGLPKIKA